ncbi:MAG: CHASE3 domain-containing protein [Pseudomonadales bacterium]|nr:CHASE3 domain-containing protein [Pseudomonadales bacterium]
MTELNDIYYKSGNENAQVLIASIEKSLVDQEASQRGYLITGQDSFLKPFSEGHTQFVKYIARLKNLIENAYQKDYALEKIESIESALRMWHLKSAEIEISARKEINKTGLSPLEFLQRLIVTGVENDNLNSIKSIMLKIQNTLNQDEKIIGERLAINISNNIVKLESSFVHYMVNGEHHRLLEINRLREKITFQLVELSIYSRIIPSSKPSTNTSTASTSQYISMSQQIEKLKHHITQWYQQDIEPAMYARKNIIHGRSTAATQIQSVLKQGVGKNILDEIRYLADDIENDFIKAKNTKGAYLTLLVKKNIVDQETGQRGFIITGDESFLEPYNSGNKMLRTTISELRNIALQSFDIDTTLQLINEIDINVKKWVNDVANPKLELRKSLDTDTDTDTDRLSSFKKLMGDNLDKAVLDTISLQQEALNRIFIRAENKVALRISIAISKDLVDMKTGERGFIGTGKKEYLQPYEQGIKNIHNHIAELKDLVNSGYHAQIMLEKIDTIRVKADEWREKSGKPEILLRRELDKGGASMHDVTLLIERETGKLIIDDIRLKIANFIQIEKGLIDLRSTEAEAAAAKTLKQTIFGTIICIVLIASVAVFLLNTILKSLKNLDDATRRVAKGDFATPIKINSDDQIGRLASAFNTMMKQLETAREKMLSSTKDIEAQALILKKQNKDLEDTQKALHVYAEELENSSSYKSEFLATMSHEIRTPMNGVIGMLSLLKTSDLKEDQLKKANMAHESAQSLICIINDILDFSKVDAGKMELEILDFDLLAMLGGFTETMAIKAQEKKLELILDVTGIDRSMVKGDPSRIRQILNNLVGNAIKFTHEGHVIIRASIERNAKNNELGFHCSILDTGIGVTDEKQKGLFEAFRQADASTTREYGGTGLGLSIVKSLCELMNGAVSYSRCNNGGSCFEFSLKLQQSEKNISVIPKLNIKALRLLIVDSHDLSNSVLSKQLEHWGATVQVSTSGEEALALLLNIDDAATSIDFAFIDASLSDMDGTQLAKVIQSQPKLSSMKLILMTPIDDKKDAQYYSELGFDAHFSKPVTPSDILDSLAITAGYPETNSVHNTETKTNTNTNTDTDTDTDTNKDIVPNGESQLSTSTEWLPDTRILVADDNYINQEMINYMLEDLDLPADIVSDGQEALDMLNNALDSNPYTLVLMDCQMPVMDGYTTTQNIRNGGAGKQYQSIPIIALTANAMKGDKQKCIDKGMNDYLTKPLEIEDLEEMLQKWISKDNRDEHSLQNRSLP